MNESSQQPIFRVDKYQAYEEEAVLFEQYSILMYGSVHIPADTRSAFPVISVQSPVSIQCCWQS